MTPAEFRAWQERLGLTYVELRSLTGWSPDTIARYRRDGSSIPPHVELACETLEARLRKPTRRAKRATSRRRPSRDRT